MNSKIRLLVTFPIGPNGLAGAGLSTCTLVAHLPPERYEITVVVLAQEESVYEAVREVLPEHVAVRVLASARARDALWRLRGELRRVRPALIMANVLHVGTLTLLARWLAGVRAPVVTVERGTDLRRRTQRLHVYFTYLFSRAMVAVSHSCRDALKAACWLGRGRKLHVIYNPFDIQEIQARSQEPLSLDIPTPRVVSVGRLFGAQKDTSTLLRAIAELHKQDCPVQLLLVGDGPDRTKLEAQAKELGIAEYVHFLGWQANPYPYIRASQVLVLSSFFEGLPRVLIEALALGTPVVSTDCPSGPAEILENGAYGRLVPIGQPTAMAMAIKNTLDSPPAPEPLIARAGDFAVAPAIARYDQLFTKLHQN